MSFSDVFYTKMALKGGTARARNYRRAEREFNQYFENTLTRSDCLIDGRPAQAVFQDHSQSNNKDLSDDKYMVLPNGIEIGVGSYVKWSETDWLVFTSEYKTIPTHQQLKLKHVNRKIKWLIDKDKKLICNKGQGWNAYVQNQTLYTLGVSFAGNHLPLANAKMSVFIQDNEETRAVKIGTRLLIAGQVYKVEFADYVSRPGLVNWLLGEDTRNSETDNFELGVADYYQGTSVAKNESASNDSPLNPPESSSDNEELKVDWNIEGDTRMRLGRSYVLTAQDSTGSPVEVTEWIVDQADESPLYILEHGKNIITVRVKDNYSLVGQLTTVAAKSNGEIKNITIKIIKKFG